MTESKENTWFFKCDKDFITNYRQKVKNHIKVITRINPDFPNSIKTFRKLFPDSRMAKRIRKNEDPENTLKYNWDLTPYDNTGYGDEYNYISFIIVLEENFEELMSIIKNNFKNIFTRKSSGLRYTLKINPASPVRGIWKNRILNTKTKYPIAILSFGRYNDYGRTHKLLTKLKINHYLFVEPFEYELYSSWYNNEYCKLVKAPEDFHLKNMGSTPMRNYILDYYKVDHERVWLLDDNIKCYKRLYRGVKNQIEDAEIFTSVEKYISKCDNVGIVSHNFSPFVVEGGCRGILCKNGKCYSSMLVPTDSIRFKHKHQEDNFISIEYISKGYTTLCFNHIVYDKNTSGQDDGGNTKFIYKKEEQDIGRKERFDYSFKIAKELIESGDIKLKEGKTLNNLIFHKPLKHEHYHIEFNYDMLENYNNDLIQNDKNYDYNYTLYLEGEVEDPREELMKLSKEELVEMIINKK